MSLPLFVDKPSGTYHAAVAIYMTILLHELKPPKGSKTWTDILQVNEPVQFYGEVVLPWQAILPCSSLIECCGALWMQMIVRRLSKCTIATIIKGYG